ncbi:hypothetical protein DESC_290164 [Desulfosarcina cetonica]|nr:hypothetical protein DESC_290164 [Desulfosarcina cetonica]
MAECTIPMPEGQAAACRFWQPGTARRIRTRLPLKNLDIVPLLLYIDALLSSFFCQNKGGNAEHEKIICHRFLRTVCAQRMRHTPNQYG